MRSDSAEKEQPKKIRVEECTRNALNITVKQKGETRKMIEHLYQEDKDPGVPVVRVERYPKLDLIVNRKGQLSQVPVVRIEDSRSKQVDRNAKPTSRHVLPSAHFIKRSVASAPKLRSRNALGFDERKPDPTREERIEQSRQMQIIEAQRLTEKEELRRDQKAELRQKKSKSRRTDVAPEKRRKEEIPEGKVDPNTPRVAPVKKFGPEREVLQQRIGNWMLKMGVQEGHQGLLTQLAIASVEAHGFDKRVELIKEIQPYLADKTNVLVDLLAKYTTLVDGILHPNCYSVTASADAHHAELFLNKKQLSDQKRRFLRQCLLNMQEVLSKLGNPEVEESKKHQYRAMIPKIKETM